MKKTILYDTHIALGAKMAPFGGYIMPIQYEGIVKEHFAARNAAALFDTCHMGEFEINGDKAVADLENILSCNVLKIKTGQCKYGFICNHEGGVIDDQVIYRMSDTSFFMVVNASTQDSDFAWLSDHCSKSTILKNCSEETAKIDIQGPHSVKIVQRLLKNPVTGLAYYTFMHNFYNNAKVLISRTGYTGEIGFELYLDADNAKKFWNECMELGAKPAGLGARDTLRLEMGLPLYGHELGQNRNAAESYFTRAIATDKNFIGSGAINNPANIRQALCGILLPDRRAARNGDKIFDVSNVEIGIVTSGSFAPSIERAAAIGYIQKEVRITGTSVIIRTGRHELNGVITDLPFYKNATARKKIIDFI
jgi:aminomethyltransferase